MHGLFFRFLAYYFLFLTIDSRTPFTNFFTILILHFLFIIRQIIELLLQLILLLFNLINRILHQTKFILDFLLILIIFAIIFIHFYLFINLIYFPNHSITLFNLVTQLFPMNILHLSQIIQILP